MISTFISYRRDGAYTQEGTLYARNISLYFEVNHKDIALFYDMDSMKAGKFNTQIFSAIRKCDCVVLLLPKGAFDRCGDPDDWLRREIRLGLQNRKPFIPVFLEGFEWPETLPDDIADIRNYQGITLYNEHFNEIMEKLALRIRESVRGTRRPKKRSTNLPAIALSLVILLLGGIMAHRYITGLAEKDGSAESLPSSDDTSDTETGTDSLNGLWNPSLTIYGTCNPSGEYAWSAKLEQVESLTYWIADSDSDDPIRENTLESPTEANVLSQLGTSPIHQDTTIHVEAEFTDGTAFEGYYYISASEHDFGDEKSPYFTSLYIEQDYSGLLLMADSTQKVLLCKYQPQTGSTIYTFDYSSEPSYHAEEYLKTRELLGRDWLTAYAMSGSGNYTIHTYRIPDSVKNPQ